MPDFVADFLKCCSLNEKTIIPFITAAKTGKKNTLEEIKEIFPNSKIKNYYFQSQVNKDKSDDWIRSL